MILFDLREMSAISFSQFCHSLSTYLPTYTHTHILSCICDCITRFNKNHNLFSFNLLFFCLSLYHSPSISTNLSLWTFLCSYTFYLYKVTFSICVYQVSIFILFFKITCFCIHMQLFFSVKRFSRWYLKIILHVFNFTRLTETAITDKCYLFLLNIFYIFK